MAARQKAALLAVVCLGGLVIIAAIVRLTEVLQFNLSTDRMYVQCLPIALSSSH
jgi:hypothetical protein